MDILVFGGTTQGRQLSVWLSRRNVAHYYSTKTELPASPSPNAVCIFGGMDAGKIATFCANNSIRIIVDASHPFAELLHEEIATAAEWTNIPVYRFERPTLPLVHNELVAYCSSFPQALDAVSGLGCKRLLTATGVNTIEKITRHPVSSVAEIWYRILNRQQSIDLAKKKGIDDAHIIASEPPISAAKELSLLRQYQFDGMLTKESGETGGLQYKISACLGAGIPIIVVKKPALPLSFLPYYSLGKLVIDILHRK